MPEQHQPSIPILVIGAGVAGLSAALHLAERGLSPLVLEANPLYVGGRLAGGEVVELDGWRFRQEHGVHGIWSPYRNLQAMLVRHGLRPVLVPAQEENWIYKRDSRVKSAAVGTALRHSWVPAPLNSLALFFRPRFLAMLGPRDWLTLILVFTGLLEAVAIDPLREGQPMEDLWLSDMVRGWAPALRAFFVGLARNGLSAQPNEIPLSGFIAFLRFYLVLRRDSWAFSYLPADGGSSIAEPLAGKVQELGGTIWMGTRATRLERADDGWCVSYTRGEETGSLWANQVVLAVDSPAAAGLLRASPGLQDPCGERYWPRGTATAVVRVWFDRTPGPGPEAGIFSGDFTVDNYFWLHRLQDQYVEWHRGTGGSAIEVHIYGPPAVLEEPDAVLLARAIADIQNAFPELRGHRLHQVLQRNDSTHTLFGLGRAERHLGIETPWPGLYCCGDWVRHPTPAFFLERACVTGIAAANAALAAAGRPAWPMLEYLPPEPLAAGIERVMLGGRRVLRRYKRRKK